MICTLILCRYSFTVLSNVFVYCIAWAVLHITDNKDSGSQIGPDDAKKFQEVVFIGLGIGALTSVLFHIFVKEQTVNNVNGNINCETVHLFILHVTMNTSFVLIYISGVLRRNARTISVLFKDIRLYQIACIYMPTRLFVNLSQIYIPLYLHKSLHMPATSLAVVPLIIFLSSFVMSLIIEKLNTKLGRKVSYCLGVMLGICSCIWIHFGTGVTYIKYEIYPVALILGNVI